MRTLYTYIMVFPKRSAFVLVALLIAGIAEGLSLTALLPLLSIAVGEKDNSGIGQFMDQALNKIGIEPSLDMILLIIVGGMFAKGLILLLANRQVGYTVAHVATALRLDLIEALLASRWQ
ncbi:MAG: ABC transporter ATP-binding protein, partial [Pseudomonadota bacterium]